MNRKQGIYLSLLSALVSLYFFCVTLGSAVSTGYEKSMGMLLLSGLFLFMTILFAVMVYLFKTNRDAILDRMAKKKAGVLAVAAVVALAISQAGSFGLGAAFARADWKSFGTMFNFSQSNKKPAEEEQNPDFQGELDEDDKPEEKPASDPLADAKGTLEITDFQNLSDQFDTADPDLSAMLVKKGGQLTLTGSVVTKSGDSTDPASSNETGLNSAILVTQDGSLNILSSRLTSTAAGAPLAALCGNQVTGNIQDSILTTNGDDSFVLGALSGASLTTARNQITSNGIQSPLVRLSGSASFTSDADVYQSAGEGSPLLCGQGTASLTGISAFSAQSALIELDPSSQLDMTGSTVSGSGRMYDGIAGLIRLQGDGILEHQIILNLSQNNISFTQDSPFAMNMPLFSVFNAGARIYLSGNTISAPSGLLCFVQTGRAEFVLDRQSLSGCINGDANGDVSVEIEAGSSFVGGVNALNTCKKASVKLSAGARWVVTQDTYLTSLETEDPSYSNIDFGACHVFVNGNPIN